MSIAKIGQKKEQWLRAVLKRFIKCSVEVRDMIIIRNICHDIKEKIHDSDKDIRKAIELKYEYPTLANDYYEFSVERMQEALDLHSKVVKIIEEYRKQEGEPNETMRNLWEFEHKIIIEQSEDVKILQEHYNKL